MTYPTAKGRAWPVRNCGGWVKGGIGLLAGSEELFAHAAE